MKLNSPLSGSVMVDPRASIAIFAHGDVDERDVDVFVDGVPAIVKGEITPEFMEVDKVHGDVGLLWTIRPIPPLPPRCVMVTGSVGPSRRMIEERFYVRGAQEVLRRNLEPDEQWCPGGGGAFISSHGKPFPGGFSVRKDGQTLLGDDAWYIPPEYLSPIFDIAKCGESWAMVSACGDRVYVYNTKRYHCYHFKAFGVKIQDNMIHMVVGPNKTLHIPANYQQMRHEIYEEDCFSFQHPGQWDISFFEGVHIWRTPSSFIVKRGPDPISGQSDDIFWTAEDVGVKEIKSVRSVNVDEVLVNGKYLVNTHRPQVTKL